MNIAHYAIRCYEGSARNGWWDKPVSYEEQNMLMIGELSEAVSAYRHDRLPNVEAFESRLKELNDSINPLIIPCDQQKLKNDHFVQQYNNYIKDTVADELADAAMIVLGALGSPTFFEYNAIKNDTIDIIIAVFSLPPFREWASHSFYENCCFIISDITNQSSPFSMLALRHINELCRHHGYDLEWHIQQKLIYNTLRPKRKTW